MDYQINYQPKFHYQSVPNINKKLKYQNSKLFISFFSSANSAFLLRTFCLIELSSCPEDVSLSAC